MKHKSSKKPKPPPKVEVEQKQLEEILESVKPHLPSAQYKILESAIMMLIWLQTVIKEKSFSISRLARMFFGKRTESMKNLKDRAKRNTDPNNQPEKSPDQPNPDPEKPDPGDDQNSEPSPSVGHEPSHSEKDEPLPSPENPKKKNHGRRPLDDYDVSKITHIILDGLKEKQRCPDCEKGKLYYWEPEVMLVIKGQSPLKGEAYCAQGLRCNLCGKIFRATFPKEVATQPKADMSARAMVCLAKYQLGTPLYRLETWQKMVRLPISDSEMWEWTESVALAAFPVYQSLLNLAAQGNVIHNDDTSGKILELMEENKQFEKIQQEALEKGEKSEKFRKGMYTSILLSINQDYQIPIYVTGRKNAGENLDDLLDRRLKDLKKPIQSCDASTSNRPERHDTEISYCNNHARHNFCELVEVWPKETLAIVEMYNAVFRNDRKTKEMSAECRLKYHQKHSAPVMEKLKSYCNGLLDDKVVEPNSSFGKAINYLNNHWEGLTFFLKNGEAPLSNNAGERAIKSNVLIRKNSYFYKSCWGAMVGDILLSIIKTCTLNSINPCDYLIAIQANADKLEKNPNAWLPWNFTKNVSCPIIKAQSKPKEEIYRHNPTGPPDTIPVEPQPDFENEKKSLRQRAREFFRNVYPKKWRETPT